MSSMHSRLFIIGAGFAGCAIAREILQKKSAKKVAAFIDDDRQKIGTDILGIPVMGPINSISRLLKIESNDEALIAMPSSSRHRLRSIYRQMELMGFRRIKIVPAVSQIIGNGVQLALTRDINPLDILGRSQKNIDLAQSLAYVHGKRVLITGAGGTIGSEIARLLLYGGVSRMYILGHGENSIFEIEQELRLLQNENVGVKTDIIPIIGELQDKNYVQHIFRKLQADIVFHTAAYKHVNMAEDNPIAVIANNVYGTLNVIHAIKNAKVGKLILISTDKAVEPVSIYGASKNIAEHITLLNKGVVVRFGNVLGSRGSIIPTFQKQIEYGGPLTVTSPEAHRFFMTISEAAALVLNTCSIGVRGALYLLDMGDDLNIRDIAEQLIYFYGYTPNKEIDIRYTGMRSGEKKREKLLATHEEKEATTITGIHRILFPAINSTLLNTLLENIYAICYYQENDAKKYRDAHKLRMYLRQYIPTLR